MYLRTSTTQTGTWSSWKRPFWRLKDFLVKFTLLLAAKKTCDWRFILTVLVPKFCNTRLLGALTGPMQMHGGQQLSWWNGCKPLVGTLVMTGLLHRKSWENDMADGKRKHSLLKTLGIRKAIQWSFEAWNMMPKDNVHASWWKLGIYPRPVVSQSIKSLYILLDASDESETNFD